jgi:hypothetical protein
MLLYSTRIAVSTIHGLGCFTTEDIKQGATVWQYDDRLDRRIPKTELPNFPKGVQEYLNIYAYEEDFNGLRVLTLCGDQAKHMNHADAPNLSEGPLGVNLAARDIAAGEELTCDYRQFDLSVKF